MWTTWPVHLSWSRMMWASILQASSVVVLHCWGFRPAIWWPVSGGGILSETGLDIWCGAGRWSMIRNHTVESSWQQQGICWFWLATWQSNATVVPASLLKPSERWTGSGEPVLNLSVKSGIRGEHAAEITEAVHDLQRLTLTTVLQNKSNAE